jgi:hypothetical protein
MTDPTVTPSRLWKRMSAEQRLRAALALWSEREAAAEQRQAAQLIAQQRKFRLKTVLGLDDERKARYLATLPDLADVLASRVLVLYHLVEQRPMMSTFLDALGIRHENGLIHEDAVAPDPAKLPAAVAAITERFPADDVSLYLNTLLWQDPASWEALRTLPDIAEREAAR